MNERRVGHNNPALAPPPSMIYCALYLKYIVTNFWDVTPCSPIEVHLYLKEKYFLYLQERNFSQVKKQHEEGSNKTEQQSSASRTHIKILTAIFKNIVK
jgi:hypothetical protein